MMDNAESNSAGQADFLPGAGFHFLTPLYELIARPMLAPVWRDVVKDVDGLSRSMLPLTQAMHDKPTGQRALTPANQ